MNGSVILNTDLFAALGCQAVSGPMLYRSRAAGEARRAFANTPPLAEIRKESRPGRGPSLRALRKKEAGSEQVIVHETWSPGEPLRPKTEDVIQESTSEVGTEGEETPGLPAMADDRPAAGAASERISNREDKAPAADSHPAGAPVADDEKSADTTGTTVPPENSAGGKNPPSGAAVAATATANSELNKVTADTGPAVASDQATGLGSPDASATEAKMGVITPVATESPGVDQTPSERQPAGENAGDSLSQRASPLFSEGTGDQAASHRQANTTEGPASAGPLLDSREEATVQPEPMAPSQAGTVPVIETFSTFAKADASSPAETILVKSPVGSLGTQILDSVQVSLVRGDRQLLIRLDPPELGSVTVRFQEQRGVIEGMLEVSRDQTRWEVEQALPQALRSLQEAGIQIRRLEVVVSDQSEKEPGREHWPQDEGTERQGTGRDEGWQERPSRAPWAVTFDGPLGRGEGVTAQIDAAAGRINMLI